MGKIELVEQKKKTSSQLDLIQNRTDCRRGGQRLPAFERVASYYAIDSLLRF